MMKSLSTRHVFSQTFAHLALVVFGFFYMYPFLWMLASSLKTRREFLRGGLGLFPQQVIWNNYVESWQSANFSVYFGNTVLVAVTTTILVVILTSMAGYALARHNFPGRRLLIITILVTMFLPRGYTIIPIFELIKTLNLLNTLWSVILVNTATSMVFNTFLFFGYFTSIPRELEESAKIDGANTFTIYWRIAMPMARPMIGAVILFEFIDNWNSFFVPLVFTLGRPDLRTMAVGIYSFVGENTTDWTLLCAAATMSLVPTMVLFFLLQRVFIDSLTRAIRG